MLLFNELEFYRDNEKVSVAINSAKELFGENNPYEIESQLDGKIVIFNNHFITVVREAMTSGCMSKMNADEEILFSHFVEYQNGSEYRDITYDQDFVLKSLDEWMVDEINGIAHPAINGCYNSPTHTWTTY